MLQKSIPSLTNLGVSLFSPTWDLDHGEYGILAPIIGSLEVGLVSLPIILVFSIPLTIFTEEYLSKKVRKYVDIFIDLTAGIPTVIFAYLGVAFLSNNIRQYVEIPLHKLLGFLPVFGCYPLTGQNLLTASLVLSVSTISYTAVLLRESLRMIPLTYIEAMYSTGLVKEEVIIMKISMIKPAVISAILLSLSRVLTETTIVSLLAGNQIIISPCLFSPVSTIPSLIVNNFGYSTIYPLVNSVLFFSSLILFVISLLLNLAGLSLNKKLRAVFSG
ncbi:PstC family ABC transporter permease [Thermogladius sp. 4427co]|uniref:PstC family ABC transporter permease n=1 Tax=Thermogladius sp. 4427co TaxID=3450718 RepID=UPI003F7A81E9